MISPTIYDSRKALYEAGLHNSYQKGIGKAKDGSDLMSIVLSGGYVDDEDFGNTIIYTGEGGRDAKTGLQAADQSLEGGNLGLLKAFESGQPVYVTRGSNHKGEFSPERGYAFAGKFLIQEHWIEKGVAGFDVVRFKLVNDLGQPNVDVPTDEVEARQASRVVYTSTRIVRDTKVSKKVKVLYSYACQVCGIIVPLPSGDMYAEGAHIKPLGLPHNGPDTIENILCLCPTHHLMFDRYCYSINPNTHEIFGDIAGKLNTITGHDIDKEYLQYHWDNYQKHH